MARSVGEKGPAEGSGWSYEWYERRCERRGAGVPGNGRRLDRLVRGRFAGVVGSGAVARSQHFRRARPPHALEDARGAHGGSAGARLRAVQNDVVQDVNLRAIGGMVAGNVERTLLWQVVGVHWQQIISHGDMQLNLALKLRKERKVAPPQTDKRAGVRRAGYSTPNAVPRYLAHVYESGWLVVYRVVPVSLTATLSELCRFLSGYFFFWGGGRCMV